MAGTVEPCKPELAVDGGLALTQPDFYLVESGLVIPSFLDATTCFIKLSFYQIRSESSKKMEVFTQSIVE